MLNNTNINKGDIMTPEEIEYCTFEPDGDCWICYDNTFINLQESDHIGFGDIKEEAYKEYCKTFSGGK